MELTSTGECGQLQDKIQTEEELLELNKRLKDSLEKEAMVIII